MAGDGARSGAPRGRAHAPSPIFQPLKALRREVIRTHGCGTARLRLRGRQRTRALGRVRGALAGRGRGARGAGA